MTWEMLDSVGRAGLCALALLMSFDIGVRIGRRIRSWVRR